MVMPAPSPTYLPSDPRTPLSVSLLQGSPSAPFIVFLTGLVKPAASFQPCIDEFLQLIAAEPIEEHVGILTWDRYGQGLSGKQQQMHDVNGVVKTLRELLEQVLQGNPEKRPIIMVGNSIGCPIARIYASRYSGVKGLLFLDSMIAHSDYVSIFEPRSGESIDAGETSSLEKARKTVAKIFHASVPNAEGFNRLDMKNDVPYSNKPALLDQPWITVVGHDRLFFAKDSEQKLGIPSSIIDKYLNDEWSKYNHGLLELTESSKARGPIIAAGADHFIQESRPDLVAEELKKLLWSIVA